MSSQAAPSAPYRLSALLRSATLRLAAAGVGSPRVDAELLLAHALRTDRRTLQHRALLNEDADAAAVIAYEQLVARREHRVPLQHLTGTAAFRRITLAVGPGVFIPRPETEVLVELALTELRGMAAAGVSRPRVVDLCTGSGAVAFAIKDEHPSARLTAVELMPEALTWARQNIEALGLDVNLRHEDARAAAPDLLGAVDLVTCNPPYIPPGGVPVDPEVRDHDPVEALYGLGEDGLELPLGIAARAAELLRPGGVMLMEHADVQGEALSQGLQRAGCWAQVRDHTDLAGRPRVARSVRA